MSDFGEEHGLVSIVMARAGVQLAFAGGHLPREASGFARSISY
jgi:hypothetical protein